jgi:two-component system, OmpR family, response regulator RpaB|tara:strand:- start:16055 stop:16771 length:717 start_codon:yes stop_codon:yes gene_type:complete
MKTYSEKILLIDSNSSSSQLIKKKLSLIGYTIILSNNGKDAFIKFQKEQPALLILDLMLPDIDGYTFCTRIRKESVIPIIIITSLDTITDRILSFNLGVDDFLKKPFYLSELEVRTKAILKRAKICKENSYEDEKDTLTIGKLKFNFRKKKVYSNNKFIKLTEIELNILELLITKAGQTLSRDFILKNIWGYTPKRYGDDRIIDVHISRLRSKLEEQPNNPDLIITDWGNGYMFYKFQ